MFVLLFLLTIILLNLTVFVIFFFFIFLEDISPFCGPLVPLFWTSGDICPGFQSQGGSLACFLACGIPSYETHSIIMSTKLINK